MRRLAAALAVAPALMAGSCSLLLDFEELTAGGADASTDGPPATCSADPECDDGNPCTEDRCDLAQTPARCSNEKRVIVADGISRTLSSDSMSVAHRVSLTTTGQRFYLSAFYENASGQRDVSLHYFDVNGTAFEDRGLLSAHPKLSPLRPLSGASLTVDTAAPPNVHAYVAAGQTGEAVGRVFHLVADLDFGAKSDSGPAADDANYDTTVPTRPPIAWRLGATVHGAWIDPSGHIYFHSGSQPLSAGTPADLMPNPPAQRLAPAGTPGTPGAVWLSDGPHVQLKGGTPAFPLFQCNTAGVPFSIGSVPLGVGDTWAAIWTRHEPGKAFSLETAGFGCTEATKTCLGQISVSCDPSPVRINTRNATFGIVRRDAEPGFLYQIGAIPEVDLPAKTARMIVRLRKVNSDPDAGAALDLETRIVSDMPLVGQNKGADFPAVAVAGESVFAVAWVEPGPNDRDQIRVERYRICYPN